MNTAFFIPVLLLLLLGTGTAYEYRMPVNIQATTNPSVLMPGDEAVLAIELQNGAAAYGAGGTAGAGTTAAGTVLSTPINQTTLKGTNEIHVISSDYKDLGMIGPNDKITLYYTIKTNETAPNRTYFLDFNVQGGYDMVQINRQIPVKVDSSAVNIARADVPTKPSIDLNVANPRENTLNAVTIIPSAPGVRFSPDQYYIGTMDPDEVFTISFAVDSSSQGKPVKGPINLTFVSEFKNGDNWRKSGSYIASYIAPVDNSNYSFNPMLVGIAGIVLLLGFGGFYLYRRKKINGKPKQTAPSHPEAAK